MEFAYQYINETKGNRTKRNLNTKKKQFGNQLPSDSFQSFFSIGMPALKIRNRAKYVVQYVPTVHVGIYALDKEKRN